MVKPNPGLLETTKPFSLMQARRMFAGSDPVKLALLLPALFWDYGFRSFEFTGTLSANEWTTAVTTGGGPTPFAYNAQRGGTIQGQTGIVDNDATAIHCAQTYLDPDDNPFMLIRWMTTAVTDFSFEIGFSDPKTDEALPGCSDIDGTNPTITSGTTDILAVHMDTDQALKTAALVGDGTTGASLKSAIYLGGPGGSTGYTPSTSTWQTFVIGCRDNLGYCAIWDGDGFVGRFSVGNAPDGGVLVRPYALFRTRTTTNRIITIKKIVFGWEENG